jgi:hypothetical protein
VIPISFTTHRSKIIGVEVKEKGTSVPVQAIKLQMASRGMDPLILNSVSDGSLANFTLWPLYPLTEKILLPNKWVRGSNPRHTEIFPTGPEAHQAFYKTGTGFLSRPLGGRGHGVNHPPSTSSEVKEKVELYIFPFLAS